MTRTPERRNRALIKGSATDGDAADVAEVAPVLNLGTVHLRPWTSFCPATPHDAVTGKVTPVAEGEQWYGNSRYSVAVRSLGGKPEILHLSIHCHDRCTRHDWRDLQRIKNELVGEEYEAVELYPAKSRTVDTSNQYHLWVVLDADFRWPFGWGERYVLDEAPEWLHEHAPGAQQRRFPNGITI